MFTKIFLYTAMLSFLSGNLGDYINRKVTVIGTAWNAKRGAVVETDKGHYYLNDLDKWDEKYYGKKVKVSGKLVIEEHEQQSTDSVEVQEIVGTIWIIKRPKWSLVEQDR